MDLTVVIPARNEAETIEATLQGLAALDLQILVVDDHSTDRTAEIAAPYATVVANPGPAGYGYAIRCGLSKVTSRWVTIMVADGSDSVQDLWHMWNKRHHADLVFGDRWRQGTTRGYPALKYWLNRYGNEWIAAKTETLYTDWTNPFKLFPTQAVRRVLHTCRMPGHAAGLELTLKVWQECPSFVVVPHHWQERAVGQSKFRLWRDAWAYWQTVHMVLGIRSLQ